MNTMHSANTSRSPDTSQVVDNADWLKTVAIIAVAVGHIGHFFIRDDQWWSVFGRLAAPTFFFLIGYARARSVPFYWIWLGIILTVLESLNADWNWVSPNILLSFALLRAVRPYALAFLQRYGWIALAILVCALIGLVPVTGKVADYGAGGWLWALFGLCQRIYVDGTSPADGKSEAGSSAPPAHAAAINASLMRFWPASPRRSRTSGRNKRNIRFHRSISRSLFSASEFCPRACVCSGAARAASSRQNR